MTRLIQKTCLLAALVLTATIGRAQQAYFQQELQYEIHVRLDDQLHFLHGGISIVYQNNSPQPLSEMYMHLWPNAYRDTKTAFARQEVENGSLRFQRSDPATRGYIDSLTFKMDGQPVTWEEWQGNADIALLKLPKPIPPGGKATITTPFRVKLPNSYSRLGHVEQQYQICQWYPKPAVYDREGWHPMPYLDQGEFYSEYGTFDVHIELPKNYVVGATGDLAPNDPEWDWILKREAQSVELLQKPLPEAFFKREFAENDTKTLHFHQENVHDFAWFADKDYYILADTVQVPQSGRDVRCVAMFTNMDRALWTKAPDYIAQTIYYYSSWNGDYPYNHATAVDGALSAGAGMEYPNVTVLGAGGSASNLEMVTMHEVGHNWYYGIFGSNERAYPWMDEGLNTYFEGKYWMKVHGDSMDMIPAPMQSALGIDFTHTFMARVSYDFVAGQGTDQPVQLHAADYSSINYGVIAYMKSGLVFNYLEAYLGADVTDLCFHEYFERWKFKHPGPDDIQAVFEEVGGKDLDWFFDEYLLGVHKPDFRISKLRDGEVTVHNSAKIALPAAVSLIDREGNVLETVWTEPFLGDTTLALPNSEFYAARLNADGVIPEFRKENNTLRAKGLCGHARPLALHLGYKYPDPNRANLYILPAIGYNTSDGFMGGVLLYSGLFPKKKYEFHAMPMFGFGSSRLVGSAGFTARWLPSELFSKIEYHARVSSFANIARIKNYVSFEFRPSEWRSPWRHKFTLAMHILADRPEEGTLSPEDWYLPVYGAGIWDVNAHGTRGSLDARVEIGGNTAQKMGRASAEAAYTYKVGKKAEAYVRGFAGGIFSPDPQPYLFQYRVSGSLDPFGEQVLLDRAGLSPWLSHQITRDHGGFSSLTGGSHDRALLAVNAHFKLPFKMFSVFGDYAVGLDSDPLSSSYYDAGIRVNLIRECVHVNFPVVGTTFGGLPADGAAFWQGVNFSIDPLRLTRDLLQTAIPGN